MYESEFNPRNNEAYNKVYNDAHSDFNPRGATNYTGDPNLERVITYRASDPNKYDPVSTMHIKELHKKVYNLLKDENDPDYMKKARVDDITNAYLVKMLKRAMAYKDPLGTVAGNVGYLEALILEYGDFLAAEIASKNGQEVEPITFTALKNDPHLLDGNRGLYDSRELGPFRPFGQRSKKSQKVAIIILFAIILILMIVVIILGLSPGAFLQRSPGTP